MKSISNTMYSKKNKAVLPYISPDQVSKRNGVDNSEICTSATIIAITFQA